MSEYRSLPVRLAGVLVLLTAVAGCAIGPARYPAPVEDRAVRTRPLPPPPPPPRSTVEVRPLAPEEPIVPRSATEGGPFQGQPLPAPQPAPGAAAPAPSTEAPAAPPPALTARERPSNPATVALIDSAGRYAGSGEFERAAAAYERALRIDPRNAGLWHDLAVIRYQQRRYQQAESLASKANGLASPADTRLRAQNWKLIAQSRRALGDAAGADAAEAQAVVLERSGP
jgi:hypothetical protein